jgi:hypothetical protein
VYTAARCSHPTALGNSPTKRLIKALMLSSTLRIYVTSKKAHLSFQALCGLVACRLQPWTMTGSSTDALR